MAFSSSPLYSPATKAPNPPPIPCPHVDSDSTPSPAAVVGGDEGPVPHTLACAGILLPPPPAQLPPNFKPVHISEVPLAAKEQGWEEVGGRRHRRLLKTPAPPPRKEPGLSTAFKRRTFGLCFRCLAPEHFVADCRGPVRCLRCRCSGHRERDCAAQHHVPPPAAAAGGDGARRHHCSPPAPSCRSKGTTADQAHRSCSRSPPAPALGTQRSWASVVAEQEVLNLEARHDLGADDPGSGRNLPADVVGMLQPLIAAQAEALSAELQAMFAARLEEVFLPLRELVASVQGWTEQVSGLWDLMEIVGGRLALADPLASALGTHDECLPINVSDGTDASTEVGAGSMSVLGGLSAQASDDPLGLDLPPLEMVPHGMKEQDKVDQVVTSCNGLGLTVTALPVSLVREAPVESAAGASCLTELCAGLMPQVDDPPDVVFAPAKSWLQHLEEQQKVNDFVPACKGLELTEATSAASFVVDVPLEQTPPRDSHSLKLFEPDLSLGGNGGPLSLTSPTLLDELLSNFSCTKQLSLLDAPINLQLEDGSSWVGRRSGRLEKKNKDCTIPISKRAEFRLAESFGELPKGQVLKKSSEEDVQEKMKPFLRMCKHPSSPTALQAIRELVQVNG